MAAGRARRVTARAYASRAPPRPPSVSTRTAPPGPTPAAPRRASRPSLPDPPCPPPARVVPGMSERAATGATDHVDDHGREQDRDHEAAAVAMEEQGPGDPGGERAGDAHEHG